MKTQLDDYMQRQFISDLVLAGWIKRDRTTASRIRRGVIMPSIEQALAIEDNTGGAVPVRAWAQ